MFAAIRDIFLKGGSISDAIAYVFKSTGNMPTKSEGMKMIKMYQNIQKETAKIIEFPKDRITPFNKPRPTLEEMRQQLAKTIEEKKAMFPGSTDKTLFKDSPEAIAKIKAENKAAAERLRNKKKTVEDFTKDDDWDPSGMASGGIARVGYFKGKIAKLLKKPKKTRKLTKDELDDLYEEFDESVDALPYPMETVADREKFLKAVAAERAYMFQQYKMGKLDPKPGEPNRQRFLEKKLEEMELSGDKRLMTIDEIEELASVNLGAGMDEAINKYKQKNIQQKRELQAFDVTGRKKNASGGIAGQLHLNEGGRVPMIFGGPPGIKAKIASIKAALNKGKKDRIKKLFPGKISEDKIELIKQLLPEEFGRLQRLKIEQLQNLLDAIKLDKEQIAMRASHKAMNDPGLDFMMKKLDEMPGSGLTSDADLAKYVDIDQDILTLEQMIKNQTMKDRKPNAKGGLAHVLGV